jgi:hypothetical protein
MDRDLRIQGIGKQPSLSIVEGNTRLIAARFYA